MSNAENADSSRQDRLNQIIAEYLEAVRAGKAPDRQELFDRHPDLAGELEAFFGDHHRMKELAEPVRPVRQAPSPEAGVEAPTLPPREAAAGEPVAEAATLPPTDTRGKSADTAPPPGTKVRYFGDYELLEEIARGGMGVVYKARQMSLNRTVALKMILAGQLAGEEDVKRFYTEAEAAANLDHPGIVPIYEVGCHEGQHYFSMGYVEGQSLSAKITAGPLPPREAAQLTKQVCEAVAYAHEQGVIHRDLKPANVLLARSDRIHAVESKSPDESWHYEPKITDFGVAKRVEAESDLTATGQVLGTPSYMPPEQAAGKTSQIAPTSDVYSIGALLYELLTGRPPFKAETPLDTLMQVLENEPVPPRLLNPKLPRDLETICMVCLQKDPRLRYTTAQQLADDLERFLEGELIHASSINLLDRVARTLAYSQHEEQFQGWGIALVSFGSIVFLSHVVMYALAVAGYGPITGYWIPAAAMLAAILGLLWYVRPHSIFPTSSAERPIWAVWIGYLIALGSMNLVMHLRGHSHSGVFAFSAILSGFGFFVMGGHVWGGSYAIGLVFLAAAPLLAIFVESSALWFGSLWGLALLMFGWHYSRLGRRSRLNQHTQILH